MSANLPALRRRDEASASRRIDPAPLPAGEPASAAGLGRPHLTAMRPLATFLAQYVDQQGNLKTSSFQKSEKRQRATSAYIEADMLPDLLAETLRPRRERRF
ncbi:hypothetical protein [Parvibaculum sp.]|uniref:hypothetical protein n=1 Tax=Parvibaculum sp. TaxID=2024848 RepID=UPI00391B84D0